MRSEAWPPGLIAALDREADRDWGYDFERPGEIARCLSAIERVCPQAGRALREWCQSGARVARESWGHSTAGSLLGNAIGGFGALVAPLTHEESALIEDRADWDALPRW